MVVKPQNVEDESWDQYEIPQSGSYVDLEMTIPYDYTSVMHYGKYSFVKMNNVSEYLNNVGMIPNAFALLILQSSKLPSTRTRAQTHAHSFSLG